MMRVLVVEDDEATASSIELMLRSQNFNVTTTDLGEEAIDLGLLYAYDIILLDLSLPDISGYEVLRTLRARKVATPVLVVSGMGPKAAVTCLAHGAQDYVGKPFHMDDLIARMHAVVRRSRGDPDGIIILGALSVNLMERSAAIGGEPLDLTGKEYALLELLALRQGTALTRQLLANQIYGGWLEGPDINVIDVFMGRLRRKLDEASPGHEYIEVTQGCRYVLRVPPARMTSADATDKAAVSARRRELLHRLNLISSKIPDADLKPPEMDSPPIDEGSPFADLERLWAAHRRLGRQQWPASSPLTEFIAAELAGDGVRQTKTTEEILELMAKFPLPD